VGPTGASPWLLSGSVIYTNASTPFVGVGRNTQLSGNEVFGIRGTLTGPSYSGMYIQTPDPTGLPFYGYSAGGSGTAWTMLDGSAGNVWRLYNSGFWLNVSPTGNLSLPSLDAAGAIQFPPVSGAAGPMITMFSSGTTNADRMVIAHSPSFPTWGMQYQDSNDRLRFLAGGNQVMSIDLGTNFSTGGQVEIGTGAFTAGASNHRLVVEGTDANALRLINSSGPAGFGDGSKLNFGDADYAFIQEDFDDNLLIHTRLRTKIDAFQVAIGAAEPAGGAKLDVQGTCRVDVLVIDGGADFSENFDVNTPATAEQVEPGMVVCIDPANPGHLVVSQKAYDRTVAGIVSGAGGVKTGMVMGQEGSVANGKHPVALTGRVYVMADASAGPIEPGDMLTSSALPGHAMKVSDFERAHGAVIGKAMTPLHEGKGLVLVLVTLQ